jgi:hypothetical protein
LNARIARVPKRFSIAVKFMLKVWTRLCQLAQLAMAGVGFMMMRKSIVIRALLNMRKRTRQKRLNVGGKVRWIGRD